MRVNMDDSKGDSGSDSERAVERGETYNHREHGPVEVEGIWRGVSEVDSARNATENDTIIVRYSVVEEPLDGLIDTLDEFLQGIGG